MRADPAPEGPDGPEADPAPDDPTGEPDVDDPTVDDPDGDEEGDPADDEGESTPPPESEIKKTEFTVVYRYLMDDGTPVYFKAENSVIQVEHLEPASADMAAAASMEAAETPAPEDTVTPEGDTVVYTPPGRSARTAPAA